MKKGPAHAGPFFMVIAYSLIQQGNRAFVDI